MVMAKIVESVEAQERLTLRIICILIMMGGLIIWLKPLMLNMTWLKLRLSVKTFNITVVGQAHLTTEIGMPM